MEAWKDKVALVTGASAGIGAATALALADAGMQVVAVARRLQPIEILAKKTTGKGRVHALRCDVSAAADVQQLFEYISTKFGGVDLLINNAALLYHGTITDCSTKIPQVSTQDLERTLAVNVAAAVALTQRAVSSMRARGSRGHVVFLNSVAGHSVPQAGELLPINIYPATKFAITALAETLRREFSYTDTPIRVSCISPGAVDTEMIRTVQVPTDAKMLRPEDVVAAILYVVSAPHNVNVKDVIIQATGEKF